MNRNRHYFMTAARLGFGHWTTSDLPLASALWGDPEVTKFIGGPFSEEQVKKRLVTQMGLMANSEVQYWPLFLLDSDEFVGCGGVRPYRPSEQICELGYHLCRPYWGRGLAEEAGRAIIGFAFESLGAKGLFAGHHPENAASRRVLEKLGFRFTHEEFYPPTGLKHPSYVLMRSEWTPNSSAAGRSSRP